MEPFLGEIRCFSFGKVPTGWLPCNGQTLQVQANQALFSLIGNTFGGTAPTTFNLPNLQGVTPIQIAAMNGPVGGKGGTETVILIPAAMPNHTHLVAVNSSAGTAVLPTGDFLAGTAAPHMSYGPASSLQGTAPSNIGNAGGSQPHPNMQPYFVLNFCIATTGNYPPRP